MVNARSRSRSPMLLNYQDNPQLASRSSQQSSNFHKHKQTHVLTTLQTNHTSENDMSDYHNLKTQRKSYDLPLKKSSQSKPRSERQRLELYELRAAALREID